MSVIVSDTQIVDPGGSLLLMCNVTGVSNCTDVIWRGPNGPLNDNCSVSDNNSLVSILAVMNVNYTNGGIYSCCVNDSGPTNSTLVLIRPTISPPELLTSAQSSTSLVCNFQSSPKPVVRWIMYSLDDIMQELMENTGSGSLDSGSGFLHSGSGFLEPGSGRDSSENELTSVNNDTLEFDPVMFQDAGIYQCVVSFSGFDDTAEANATITGI